RARIEPNPCQIASRDAIETFARDAYLRGRLSCEVRRRCCQSRKTLHLRGSFDRNRPRLRDVDAAKLSKSLRLYPERPFPGASAAGNRALPFALSVETDGFDPIRPCAARFCVEPCVRAACSKRGSVTDRQGRPGDQLRIDPGPSAALLAVNVEAQIR